MSTAVESDAVTTAEPAGFLAVNKPETNKVTDDATLYNNGDKGVATKAACEGAMKDDNNKAGAIDGAKVSNNESMADEVVKATPATKKKRGAPKDEGGAGPAKKKRASAKSKKVNEAESTEITGDVVAGNDTAVGNVASGAETVTPPAKKGRGPGKGKKGKGKEAAVESATPPKTPKDKAPTKSDSNRDGEAPATTKKGTTRKRAAAKEISKGIPISTSLETAIAADKMLVKLKEEGKSWNDIQSVWKTMTGEDRGGSSLPTRYSRLKANFMTLQGGDDSRLLDAETDVMLDLNAAIVKIQAEKWNRVQKVMEEKGSKEKYPAAFLEKMWKELMANPAALAKARAGGEYTKSENAAVSGSDHGEVAQDGVKTDVGEGTVATGEDGIEEGDIAEAAAEAM